MLLLSDGWSCRYSAADRDELGLVTLKRVILVGNLGREPGAYCFEWLARHAICVPNKLSAAMIGAFKAQRIRVLKSRSSGLDPVVQYVRWASKGMTAGLRSPTASRAPVAPIRTASRIKAFFVSQKVNGINTP